METPLSPFTFTPKPDWFDQYKYYILAFLLIVMASGLYLILTPPITTLADSPDVRVAGNTSELTIASATQSTNGQIVVDIAGGVIHSGIYWLNAGSIIEDAIKASGGFSRLADLDAVGKTINRAQELTNHGKIYIPKKGDTAIVYTPTTTSSATASSTININTADNAELDLLPGIGPVLSQRIIDYRIQNGNFDSVDDLKNVPGIGDKLFDQLKDLVTI